MKKMYLILVIMILGLLVGCGKTNGNNDDSVLKENMDNENIETKIYDIKWGSKVPASFEDPKYGLIKINAYGNCSYMITDSELNDIAIIDSEVVSAIATSFEKALSNESVKYSQLAADKLEGEMLSISNELVSNGIEIVSINIISINLTDESKKKVSDIDKQIIINSTKSNG